MTTPENRFAAMTTEQLTKMAKAWNAPIALPPEWLVKKLSAMNAEQVRQMMDGELPESDGFFVLNTGPVSP